MRLLGRIFENANFIVLFDLFISLMKVFLVKIKIIKEKGEQAIINDK